MATRAGAPSVSAITCATERDDRIASVSAADNVRKPSTPTHTKPLQGSTEGVKTAQTTDIKANQAKTLIHRIDM